MKARLAAIVRADQNRERTDLPPARIGKASNVRPAHSQSTKLRAIVWLFTFAGLPLITAIAGGLRHTPPSRLDELIKTLT